MNEILHKKLLYNIPHMSPYAKSALDPNTLCLQLLGNCHFFKFFCFFLKEIAISFLQSLSYGTIFVTEVVMRMILLKNIML